MKASELRVGNLIEGYDGKPFEWSLEDFDIIYTSKVDPDELGTPIPLTEEWLLEFGAEELIRMSDNYVRYNLNGIQLSLSPERDFFIEYVHQIPIKYVHTLQNFYFATKQVELTIKEDEILS